MGTGPGQIFETLSLYRDMVFKNKGQVWDRSPKTLGMYRDMVLKNEGQVRDRSPKTLGVYRDAVFENEGRIWGGSQSGCDIIQTI